MAVIALLLSVVAVAFSLPGGNAACPSFNINYPPMRTLLCPGDTITYTCALSSSLNTITTQWTGSPGFQCSTPGSPNNTIALTQAASSSLNTVPVSCGNLSAVMTNISGTCYTSVLTIPTPQYFNGTNVTCTDGNFGTLIGNDTLNIQLASPPNAPNITSLISTYSNQLTVTWTSVLTATSYNVIINDSVNTLVLIPSSGSLQNIFTGLTNNTVYTVSAVAINCAGSSSPATMSNRTSNLTMLTPTPSLSPTTPSPSVSTTTNVPTNSPTSPPSPLRSDAVGIGVGVGVGIVVLLLVAIAVALVFIIKKKKVSPATPKGDNNERNEEDNYEKNKVPALPPKNTDTTPSKPEGLIYADIGLASRVPMQAPNPPELSDVTYSTVQHVL